MAKVDLHHFDRDLAFINGMEYGVHMVIELFELTVDERKALFGETLVANILDKFNFAEIHETLRGHK